MTFRKPNGQRSMWPPLTTASGRPVAGSSAGTVLVIHNDGRLLIGTVPLAVP
jgi:hypothetical protein